MNKAELAGSRGIRARFSGDAMLQKGLIGLMIVMLAVMIVLPLYTLFEKSFFDEKGQFVGVANFAAYFSTPSLLQSIQHTIFVSCLTTVISVSMALLFAFGIHRTQIRGKAFLKGVAMLPLFAPTMMYGIALVYLFGNQGLVTTGVFGWLEQGLDIHVYGPVGIVISEVVYTFPHVFVMISAAFAMADNRLYEAADTLGSGSWRKFLTVTLPNVKYGLIGAAFVAFTLSFTDFGAPGVIGGQYNVLATDIYKYIFGQANLTMGATVGLLLTIPAVISFIVDRIVSRKQASSLSSKSTPYRILPSRKRDLAYGIFNYTVAIAILTLLGTVVFATFVKYWPYNMSLSLIHYDFSKSAAGSYGPLWNSLTVAALTAAIGTVVTFASAYLIEKTKHFPALRHVGYFLALLPTALPGVVIGLAYIFFFNNPDNPLHGIYGTVTILVLANIVHFFSVSFMTATTSLKKLDKEIELVSEAMAVPMMRTFLRVTAPICLPAIMEIAAYYFVNAMVTISAVVFLYAPDLKLAAVSIVNMDDAGDVAAAAAMSVLVLLVNLAFHSVYGIVSKTVRRRTDRWSRRTEEE